MHKRLSALLVMSAVAIAGLADSVEATNFIVNGDAKAGAGAVSGVWR